MQSVFKENLFSGKKVLVTGGGTGIGLRISKELDSLGAQVIIASRKEEVLEKSIKELSERASYRVLNIRDEQNVEEVISSLDDLDMLVNNAGGQFPGPAEEISPKGWRAVIDTNLTGTFLVSQAAFKNHFKKNGGKIVNIIAQMWNGFPLVSHTGAARAAVDNLTKSLAIEWSSNGVSVNAVAPGVIHSSGLDTYDEKFQHFVREAGKVNYTGRLGTEAEVASATLFLLSPASQYITGTTLRVDGGESLFHPFWPPRQHENLKPELD